MLTAPHTTIPRFDPKRLFTILVVEDEEPIRMLIGEFLLDCGYHVLEAGTVADAKSLLAHHSVDLIFSDVNMPGAETGLDLARWAGRHLPAIKVLLTSGFPQTADDTYGLQELLIPKPYRCSAVLQRIQDLL